MLASEPPRVSGRRFVCSPPADARWLAMLFIFRLARHSEAVDSYQFGPGSAHHSTADSAWRIHKDSADNHYDSRSHAVANSVPSRRRLHPRRNSRFLRAIEACSSENPGLPVWHKPAIRSSPVSLIPIMFEDALTDKSKVRLLYDFWSGQFGLFPQGRCGFLRVLKCNFRARLPAVLKASPRLESAK